MMDAEASDFLSQQLMPGTKKVLSKYYECFREGVIAKEKLGREVGVSLRVRDGCEDSICNGQSEISESGHALSWERKRLPQTWCVGCRGQVQRLNREAESTQNAFSKECGLWKPSGGDCWISVLK